MMHEYQYENPNHSILLTQVWQLMKADEELAEVGHNAESLHSFLLDFTPPRRSFFVSDEDGITFLIWFDEWLNALSMGLWIRKDKRRAPSSGKLLFNAVALALEVKPLIISTTQKVEVVEMLRKLGYDISVVVPDLFGEGVPGYIGNLQKRNFKQMRHLEVVNE